MSRISAWTVWLALLIAMVACQGPTASEDASTTAAAAIADAEPAEEVPAPDAAAEQMRELLASGRLDAQRGLLEKTDATTPGYVLFNPIKSETTYLIDKDGQVVHTWKSKLAFGGGMYLRDNGNLFRSVSDAQAPVFGGGGQGGVFQEFTWDGELAWAYTYNSEHYRPHHDVALLPNGNFLSIAWEARNC